MRTNSVLRVAGIETRANQASKKVCKTGLKMEDGGDPPSLYGPGEDCIEDSATAGRGVRGIVGRL